MVEKIVKSFCGCDTKGTLDQGLMFLFSFFDKFDRHTQKVTAFFFLNREGTYFFALLSAILVTYSNIPVQKSNPME